MSFKKTAILGFSALALSAAALGGGYSYNQGPKRYYVGGQLGYGNTRYALSDALSTTVTSGSVDHGSHLAGRLFWGYNLNTNFALESGFIYFRNLQINNINASGTNLKFKEFVFDTLLKLTVPLQNNFAIYGKGGAAFIRVNRSYTATITGSEGRVQKLRPTAALGVSYAFNDFVSGDLSWQRVFSGSGIKNTDLAAAGLQFSFG